MRKARSRTSCTVIRATRSRCSCCRGARAHSNWSRCSATRPPSGASAAAHSSSSRASRAMTSSAWRRSSRRHYIRIGDVGTGGLPHAASSPQVPRPLRSNTMTIRWAIASVSCLALALLTLNAVPDWDFHRSEASPAGGPATSSCPANAKPANMNFTLKDLGNKDVKLTSLKGKVVLLDFWATWCGPCKIEIPWFIEFQDKYGKDGLQVIGVSVDDTQAKLKPYVATMKMNYPVLQGLDHDDIQDAYG